MPHRPPGVCDDSCGRGSVSKVGVDFADPFAAGELVRDDSVPEGVVGYLLLRLRRFRGWPICVPRWLGYQEKVLPYCFPKRRQLPVTRTKKQVVPPKQDSRFAPQTHLLVVVVAVDGC